MNGILDTVSLQGRLVPLAEARISPLDRGWLFGEGVYELVPVYAGRPLRLPAHLERLARSLRMIDLNEPVAGIDFEQLVYDLIKANGRGDMSVYLQVTRGADLRRRDHVYADDLTPTVFGMCQALAPRPGSVASEGVRAVLREDSRWQGCDIKSTSLLANTLLRKQASEHDAFEAILYRDEHVTEGAASSVFVVHDGRLLTTPDSEQILPGTTRELIIELAAADGIVSSRTPISVAELWQADEIWLASSTKEVLPVTRLNEQAVGGGRPGELWRRVDALYQDCKAGLVSA